jgi:hypothetical protein
MSEYEKKSISPPPEAIDPEEEETPQIDPFTIEDPATYPGPGA